MIKNNKLSLINIRKRKLITRSDGLINKLAFTFPEVLVVSIISGIVLSFIYIFLSDISSSMIDTKNEISIMPDLSDLSNKLNNYRNIYITGGILIDSSTGSDIFLMRDINGENGILFGPVKLENYKIDTDNVIYEDKGIGFRKLSKDELDDIDYDKTYAYDYVFQKDQIFSDIKIQDMVIDSYNSGTIFDLTLSINMDFQNGMIGQSWSDVPKDKTKIFNIDF